MPKNTIRREFLRVSAAVSGGILCATSFLQVGRASA